MRKIFSTLLVLGLMTPGVAGAAQDLKNQTPNGRCYGLGGETYAPENTNFVQNITEPCAFRVFFLNNQSEIYNNDPGCIAELQTKLQAAVAGLGDERSLFLTAAADSLGNSKINHKLSVNRMNAVLGLLQWNPENLQQALWDGKFAMFVGGDNNDMGVYGGDGKHSHPYERSVCVIINEKGNPPAGATPVEFDVSRTSFSFANTKISFNGSSKENENVTAARNRISDVAAKIKGLSDDTGRSVWKNKDGGFNTNRLISDSVAGVVLGTAGGLITSHIVKKNQIKGGLQGVHCSIGGQVVADHGDDFIVGIN